MIILLLDVDYASTSCMGAGNIAIGKLSLRCNWKMQSSLDIMLIVLLVDVTIFSLVPVLLVLVHLLETLML